MHDAVSSCYCAGDESDSEDDMDYNDEVNAQHQAQPSNSIRNPIYGRTRNETRLLNMLLQPSYVGLDEAWILSAD